MPNFIDVLLPIPLQKLFTYSVTAAESDFLKPGVRVAVPFGKSKIYTGLVYQKHQNPPQAYEAKEIYQILDETPIITERQLKNWEWIANYYMCTLGEVLRAAIPSSFLLESETLVIKKESLNDTAVDELQDDTYLVFEALQQQSPLRVHEISNILGKKNVHKVLDDLLQQNLIEVKEEVFERYKPKMVKYVKLNPDFEDDEALSHLLKDLQRAKKQHQVVLQYFNLKIQTKKPIKLADLKESTQVSGGVIKALLDKNILMTYDIQEDRVHIDGAVNQLKTLNPYQAEALKKITQNFKTTHPVLFQGVTSSGKTEIYAHLIKETISQGRQVLYLLPEIALTTQIINRLKFYFGDNISVFHSKYSLNERVEVWYNLLRQKSKAQVILGARSSVLLPFTNLGLIIVDEEHESSYKQFDPAPRYHARDVAIVLAKQHQANVLLGSATPSVESYFNVQQNKYGFAKLDRRFNDVLMPEIELIDIKEKHRKKRMNGHFSDRLIEMIQEVLQEKEQVILFQNRRGYAPIIECSTCGNAPQCPNCDVSLTYHKYNHNLKCHYCGYQSMMPEVCPACKNPTLDSKGFGTEQIELELKDLFPEAKIGRMDLDTTRGKFGYEKIIDAFQSQELDVLVGTQMLTKGLDFSKVSLVGVLNADNMLNFPDFRAFERSFQLLVQVSGRAGRDKKRGKVGIQTYNPYHQILQQVTLNDYESMFKDQINERYEFQYPPLTRMIKITLKHKNYQKVDTASVWLGKSLRNSFGDLILGPTSPAVSRIRNLYLKTILIKLPRNKSIQESKAIIQNIKITFSSISEFRSVRFVIDVDYYA